MTSRTEFDFLQLLQCYQSVRYFCDLQSGCLGRYISSKLLSEGIFLCSCADCLQEALRAK